MALTPRIRKSLRLLASLLAVLLTLVVLPLVAMQLTAVRGYVLAKLVQQAKESLPGELQVGRATWPSIGRLRLQNVQWVADGDTLAEISHFELRWEPWALARRELRLPLVVGRVSRLDVPRIQSVLSTVSHPKPGPPTTPKQDDERSRNLPWFREGAVRGLPSLQLSDVQIELANVHVADSLLLESLQLRLQSDLRAGKMPNISVQQLQLKLQEPGLEISAGSLKLDLQTGQLEVLVRTSEGSSWTLEVDSHTTEADVVDLQVLVRPAAGEPLPLLSVHGDLLSQDDRVVGLRFSSTIRTPGVALLRQLPFLRSSVASLPNLEGIQLTSAGALSWLPAWQVDVSTRVEANAWLQGGNAQLHYHNDSLRVSDIELQLAEASVRGEWWRAPKATHAQVQLQVAGTAWMSDLLPDVAAPDSLAMDVYATVNRQENTSAFEATLRAAVVQGATRIDDLRLEAAAASMQDLLFRVWGRARGWELAAAGQVMLGDSIVCFLEPLHLQQASDAALPAWSQPLRVPKTTTRIAWHSQRGLRVVDLGLTGDLGAAAIGANWQPHRGGEATLRCAWPRPPQILLRALGDSTQTAALRRLWGDQEVPTFAMQVQLQSVEDAHSVEAQGSFTLPGPRLFAFALPESVQVEDLDAIHATFAARLQHDSLDTTWNATLDLDETAWLDSSAVAVRGGNDSLFVESLRLSWDGLEVRMTGAADSSAVDIVGSLQFAADRFVARLPQADLRTIVLQAAATWHISGTPEAPDMDAEVQTRLESPWGSAPEVIGAFSMRQGVLSTAVVDAPAGLLMQGLQWQRLHVDLRPERYEHVDGSRIRLSLAAEQQELRGVLWLDSSPDMTLRADTLYVRIFDRELLTDRPFVVEKRDATWWLRDMRLSGSMGTAAADALVAADSLAGLLNLDLQLPHQPDLLRLPEGMWPESVRLRALAANNDSLAVFLQASGMQLADHSQLSVRADILSTPDSTHFRLELVDPKQTIVDARGTLPVAWSMRPLSFAMLADSLSIEATFKDFPIPDLSGDRRALVDFLDRSPEAVWANLNGTLQLVGPLAEPRGHGYWTLQPQDPLLKTYKTHVFVALAQQGRSWGAALQEQLDALSTSDLLSAPGAKLAVWVQHDSLRVVDAAAHLPVSLGFENGSLKIDSGARLRAAVRTTQVNVSDFNSLLPSRAGLEGVLTVALQADGPWRDPQLSGGFQFKDLSVKVPDGSHVRASGNIDLQGTARNPGVKGKVTVRDGLIRIPEIPRSLLPVQGEALLLANAVPDADTLEPPADAGSPEAKVDSTAKNAAPARGEHSKEVTAKTPRRDTQAVVKTTSNNTDVSLAIPGAFWIRGRGFEVELSGNLQLTIRDGQPRVVGELKAERGALQLMASKFPVKSGRVLFFGDDETNPSLDLVMGRKYGNVSVEVVVQGTAKEPIIEFRSDPQLTEDEILSYVLFGRGISELNESQTQKYDERAVALASVLTASLSKGISSRSGVDMVGLEQSAETSDRASLVVGKYLSPRVLLKYVQDLEAGQGYSVNVEYWLKGGLRLMTSTSRYNQSGMELNWSHDY